MFASKSEECSPSSQVLAWAESAITVFRKPWRWHIEESTYGIRYWHYGYNTWIYVNTMNTREGLWEGQAMRHIAVYDSDRDNWSALPNERQRYSDRPGDY